MSEQPIIETQAALYIDEPYALYIKQGIQTVYVDVMKMEPCIATLVGAKAYGEIVLDAPVEISIEQFNESRDAHRIDLIKQVEYARENPLWQDGPFYSHTLKFTPYPQPLDYEIVEDVVEKACSRMRKIKKLIIVTDEKKAFGEPLTDEERAKRHFKLTDEEWSALSNEEKQKLIEQLPPRGTRLAVDKSMVPDDDIILKPKGPWGDGFKECEAYVRQHYPKVKDPAKYCAGIYQEQKKALEKDSIEFIERPTAYDVILHPHEDGWTLTESVGKLYIITMMNKTDGDITQIKIHKISFDKSFCPCAIAKLDFEPFSGWESVVYASILPSLPSDIAKKN